MLHPQNTFTCKATSSKFYTDLYEVLVSVNFPIFKLNNLELKDILQRDCIITSEHALKRHCYYETLSRIRD